MELIIDHVTKKYGEKIALNDYSLHLKPGVLGLLGPNGAGKSTLMRMLATIEQPTNGSVIWDGENIQKKPKLLRSELGYLPQDFGVYPNMNAVEFLEYIAAMKGLLMSSLKKRINELLEALNLMNDRKRLLGGYSGGMRQRVGIAQALLNDPKLLIVDEPTVGLDPEERIRFRNLLSSLSTDRMVILSTHIVTDIESIATDIALLSKGNVLAHMRPEQLLKHVEGKVWEWVIPASELHHVQKKYIVSSAIHRSDGIHARIVSSNAPSAKAHIIAASLEDAYLYYVSSKGGHKIEQCI
ncbi:ABC transporter ATP-binding protein [Bacillus pseudomycoides]|uniref:ABC transporter ATP-binding protein n=1 Tax=Bacillus pseudomycoides TaxID=64104 RepID=UPI000BEDA9BC|nr:ABC transporter ATP-binding protein [Bacillus pseudomycoides]PEB41199.1 ABC transporter ATP-binding protein [Bacillus pseudomycoides]PGD97028.1 ABC transporter ATP-binding protein [Bacillus pseudomycoides]PGE01194.1 ABC transporter ATP-binding protein [Bacillus pseudomycoides]PHE72099.1 ABC transporter ATP-binding protein [Bacillus pseudomycoides]PHG15374.1 ABC transporter ATP-binding protein [Bacillus pseudomycoides]